MTALIIVTVIVVPLAVGLWALFNGPVHLARRGRSPQVPEARTIEAMEVSSAASSS
jgi:hypothetical protein